MLFSKRSNTNVPSIERDTHSFVLEEDVIGRDEDRMAILKMLMDDNENGTEANLSVIPIVGAGGFGKTTLVQLIFNEKKVEQHFDLKMWVCVSVEFSVKLLVGKIINSTAGDNQSVENLEMEQLRIKLHEKISGNDEVAKITSTVEPYRLGILDDDKSWSLFRKMAFKRGEEPESSDVVEIGKKIVKKCGGVPLAIEAMGGMLSFKNPETEWSSFVEKELHDISRNKEEDFIFPKLQLSYPSYLKHCFCYCSLVPKDYKIDVKDLVKSIGWHKDLSSHRMKTNVWRKWVMITLWSYFGDLSFKTLKKTSCKMHDLMHDLAISLVGKKCRMFDDLNKGVTISNETRHLSSDSRFILPDHSLTSKIQTKRIRSIFFTQKYPFVGDFSAFSEEIISTFKFLRLLDLHEAGSRMMLPNSICKLKYLRYLDLSDNVVVVALPNSITRLINLLTLKLNNCFSLEELPRDIKKLVNLRHLELSNCYQLTHMPSGFGQLTNLQTLTEFVLRRGNRFFAQPSAELYELAALNLRGELKIRNLRDWMDCEGFEPLINLKELSLEFYGGVSLPRWVLATFSNLVRFELSYCDNCRCLSLLNQLCSLKEFILINIPLEHVMDNESTRSLNKSGENQIMLSPPSIFPCLSVIYIHNCPELVRMPLYPSVERLHLIKTSLKPLDETIMRCIGDSASTSSAVIPSPPLLSSPLPNLTELCLELKNLESLPVSVGSLASLKKLEISECDGLKHLPLSSFQHLSSLQRLSIFDCKELDMCNADDDTAACQGLRSLQELRFEGLPKLTALPVGLQHVTTLRDMTILKYADQKSARIGQRLLTFYIYGFIVVADSHLLVQHLVHNLLTTSGSRLKDGDRLPMMPKASEDWPKSSLELYTNFMMGV
ncbi:NB-ARC domain, LRR domain containing protein [Parasponia andersonii]|uniref:NB-ARC domain, LRR domain containing protein n=1 Tax=Parasponia andersonii TaxID=3476 RepID=A0A2P5DAV9_PARAD|nr:NB-ARC domain, LRR domain containing protein [Parasponia andersonii]